LLPLACLLGVRPFEAVVIFVPIFIVVCFVLFAGLALVTLELELDFVLSSPNGKTYILHVFKKKLVIWAV
jgi:hypothetical protein